MGKEIEKHFSLRIDADLLRKITYIAKGEERSVRKRKWDNYGRRFEIIAFMNP